MAVDLPCSADHFHMAVLVSWEMAASRVNDCETIGGLGGCKCETVAQQLVGRVGEK
jgi:hypothetical protein